MKNLIAATPKFKTNPNSGELESVFSPFDNNRVMWTIEWVPTNLFRLRTHYGKFEGVSFPRSTVGACVELANLQAINMLEGILETFGD